jgi:hypothetical protein
MNNMLKSEEVSHNLYHLNRVTEQRCMLLRLYGAGCVGMKSAVGGLLEQGNTNISGENAVALHTFPTTNPTWTGLGLNPGFLWRQACD